MFLHHSYPSLPVSHTQRRRAWEGRPQPRSAQPQKPPDLCLIISSANNNHRQQPQSTTSPCRWGRKALWHFLYDTQSLFFSSRKQRKCSLPSLTILFSPPWQGCLDFRFPLQWFSGSGHGYVLPSEAECNIRKKKKKNSRHNFLNHTILSVLGEGISTKRKGYSDLCLAVSHRRAASKPK